jgi:sulfopyruvate decarboxylase subunit alpha
VSEDGLSWTPGPAGAKIIDGLNLAGIEHIVALPDIWTSAGLLFPIASDGRFNLIRVCREEEAIGICAGLWLAGRRAVAMMQHTGFLASINAIRGVAVESRIPICTLVGLLHKEPGKSVHESSVVGVRMLPPILTALGVSGLLVENDDDVSHIQGRLETAFDRRQSLAVLIGRRPVAS